MEYQILDADGNELDITDDLDVARACASRVEGARIIGRDHETVIEIDPDA